MGPGRTILVTGAGGQAGRALSGRVWPEGVAVRGLDRAMLDITDADTVREAVATLQPDVIVNLAAYTAVDQAETDRRAAFAINAMGAEVLARAAADAGAPLLHVSTDFVFAGGKGAPYVETDAAHPLNVYGASKLAGEQAVSAAPGRSLIVRTSWLLGDGPANFLTAILARLEAGQPFSVVADQAGSPTGVNDLAKALVKLALRLADDPEAPTGLYHLANEGGASRHALARAIADAWSEASGRAPPEIAASSTETPAGTARRPADTRLSSTAIERDFALGLRPWRAMVEAAVAARLNGGEVI